MTRHWGSNGPSKLTLLHFLKEVDKVRPVILVRQGEARRGKARLAGKAEHGRGRLLPWPIFKGTKSLGV